MALAIPDWSRVFEVGTPRPGCSEEQLRALLSSLARPLDAEEAEYLENIVRRNPFRAGTPGHDAYVAPDPRGWAWPHRGLPESYLSFLRWSNGGTFGTRSRRVEFFEAAWHRNVILTNLFLKFAPGVVPFGAVPNSSDCYAFDTSADPVGGEFPVVYVGHGAMIWERMTLADSFPDFCRGADRPDTELYWEWWGRKQRANKAEPGAIVSEP